MAQRRRGRNQLVRNKSRNRNRHLTKYGPNDLVIVCNNENVVTMEFFDSTEHLEFSVIDLPKIIDALIFITAQENKFPTPNKEGA